MKLAVIGSGYIGALNACCFAAMGHQVIGTDINEDRVRDLQQGHLPYYEEGLQELMNEGLASGACASPPTTPRGWREPRSCSSRSARLPARMAAPI